MTRKPPFKHTVGTHYRNGKLIEKYERGQGAKPRQASNSKLTGYREDVWNVTFTFPDKSTETYPASGTATGALRSATGLIQRPMIPVKAHLKLGGKTR